MLCINYNIKGKNKNSLKTDLINRDSYKNLLQIKLKKRFICR